jgi:signal transduction histidine kinase
VFRTIRWRLVASYAILILLAVTLMGTLALSFLQRYVDRQERDFLKANAESVVRQARDFLAPPTRRVALQELAYTSAFLGNARVRILDSDKAVLADSGDPSQPDEFIWLVPSGLADIDMEHRGAAPFILTLPAPARQNRAQSLRDILPLLRDLPLGTSRVFARRFFTPWGRRFEFGSADEPAPGEAPVQVPRNFLTVTMPVDVQDVNLGYIEISSPLSLQREAIGTMSSSLLFSGLGALAVAVAFGLLFGKTLTDPLRSLAFAAKRMADGDLSVRAPGSRQDEMGALARQFNGMAESLERSFRELRVERDSLKRFVADASHELRTPITALSTFIELLQGRAADDPQARKEFLEESRAQIHRLEWITANLLDLSRLDAGISALSFGMHDLADMQEEAVAPRARFSEKGIQLSVIPPEQPTRVSCDRERVIMALSNLVANALKFTPTGGSVTVSAERHDDCARFTVRDSGPGIGPLDMPRLWERFYRGKNGGEEGAGLGLAIVKSVAEAHGGSVGVESEAGKGSRFFMTIPITQRA